MTKTLYFAYGSNMLTERLQARCKTARPRGVAKTTGFSLSFSKKSLDGSGKATLNETIELCECVYGVVFDIDKSELAELDRIEGVGKGYIRENAFEVVEEASKLPILVATYLADSQSIDPDLKPYDWYLDLVIAGARQHELPTTYTDALALTPTDYDPTPERKTRIEALSLLTWNTA